jgi:hypothetical protein
MSTRECFEVTFYLLGRGVEFTIKLGDLDEYEKATAFLSRLRGEQFRGLEAMPKGFQADVFCVDEEQFRAFESHMQNR